MLLRLSLVAALLRLSGDPLALLLARLTAAEIALVPEDAETAETEIKRKDVSMRVDCGFVKEVTKVRLAHQSRSK